MNYKKLHQIAFWIMLYTLLVILWGAWVRISHSGDGCGASWPLCQGNIIPQGAQKKTWIELSHRMTSGVFGILIVLLFFKIRKTFKSHRSLLRISTATLVLTITEALLGAKLVLFGLVGTNDSIYRAMIMSFHNLNSLLLTGSIALLWIVSDPDLQPFEITKKSFSNLAPFIFIPIAMTGAWASLSATLFPSESILQGIAQDLSQDSHYLIRLRITHPILAVLFGATIALTIWFQSQKTDDLKIQKLGTQTVLLIGFGIVFGMMTLFSLSPSWMKLTHLALAHTMWIFILRWSVLSSPKSHLTQ